MCSTHRTTTVTSLALLAGQGIQSHYLFRSDLEACCLFGFSLMALFTTTHHDLIDTYSTNAAGALAAMTFVRYFAGNNMVLGTKPLYEALTVKWMLTMLGSVAALLTPMPWVFACKGAVIRRKSKWAIT